MRMRPCQGCYLVSGWILACVNTLVWHRNGYLAASTPRIGTKMDTWPRQHPDLEPEWILDRVNTLVWHRDGYLNVSEPPFGSGKDTWPRQHPSLASGWILALVNMPDWHRNGYLTVSTSRFGTRFAIRQRQDLHWRAFAKRAELPKATKMRSNLHKSILGDFL